MHIIIASSPDHAGLVAEIYDNDDGWALVYPHDGHYYIDIYGPLNGAPLHFDVDTVMAILDTAKRKLSGDELHA